MAAALLLALSGCQGVAAAQPPALAKAPAAPHKVVVIGDSLSTGFGTTAQDAWPNLINTDPVDIDDQLQLFNASTNGSGYVSIGTGNSTFGSQVKDAVTSDTQLVLFFGSENDMGQAPAAIGAAASAAFAEAKAKSPQAVMLVVGPPSYTDQPESDRLAVRDEVQDAAVAVGAMFVDPIAQGWIMGHVDDLIGPDGDHPSVAGQHYIKAQMEKLIKEALSQPAVLPAVTKAPTAPATAPAVVK
ncbi:hypothetical protein AL755_06485 [Arthrobacter sp. ERGS1:01]|nr:hypothetical protein AL755_06485 [Arthrobacter sp. ERGS1:01]